MGGALLAIEQPIVHLAVGRSHYRLANNRGNVDSRVERAFTVERIDALTE